MKKEQTKVVFRKWGNGGIIALFPQIAHDVYGHHCESYEQVGQHGGADYSGVVRQTTPAKPEEFAELKSELQRIGYDLRVAKCATYKDYLMRIESVRSV